MRCNTSKKTPNRTGGTYTKPFLGSTSGGITEGKRFYRWNVFKPN